METLSIDGSIGHSKHAGAFMNEDEIEVLIKNLGSIREEQNEDPVDNTNWDLINNLPHNKMVDENF